MSIYNKIKKYTALFPPEINFLMEAVEKAPEGSVVIAGTYKGGDAMSMMLQDSARDYHVIDSFQGLAPPVEQDIVRVKNDAGPTMKAGEFSCGGHEQYIRNFIEAKIVPPSTYPMFITEDSIKEVKPGKIAVLWLDLDHYAPTKACLDYFDQFLVDGAIIGCHDYGFVRCPGVKPACDEFAEKGTVAQWRHAAGGIFETRK